MKIFIKKDGMEIELEGPPAELQAVLPAIIGWPPFNIPGVLAGTFGQCPHEWPDPWHGVTPPSCKKCGYTPPSQLWSGFTLAASGG